MAGLYPGSGAQSKGASRKAGRAVLEPEPSQTLRERVRRLLINRDFARLWAASAVSGFGDSVFEATLIVWIVSDLADDRPWAPYVTSGLLAASALPVLLVGPIAGAFVDRWHDKRRVLIRTNLISAVLVLVLLPVAVAPASIFGGGERADAVRLGLTLVVVVLASAVVQFFRPASGVLSRDIVPEADRPRAIGLSQTAANVTMLVAPPLAAPVLITFGPGVALTLNAASFLVGFLLVRGIEAGVVEGPDVASEAASPRAILADLAVGLRFFVQSEVMRTLAVAMSIAMVGFGAINVLDIFFMRENLGTNVRYFGLLESAQGAGMIAGAIAWGFLAGRVGLERTVWVALASLGILTIVYSRLTDFPPALVLTMVIGTIVPALSIALSPIMQRETPRHLLGRVSATINPIIIGSSLLGASIGGILYGAIKDVVDARILGIHVGPLDTIYFAVGLTTLGAAAYAARYLRAPSVGVVKQVVHASAETDSG